MTDFKPYNPSLYEEQHVSVEVFEGENGNIMLVKLKGVLPDGSAARMDCNYIKQQLAINLAAMRPLTLLLDMSELSYAFGNSLIDALSPLSELQIFESKFDIAFLLSDLNKYGLASLWALDLAQPPKNIFFDYEEALRYVVAVYDSI